MDVIEVGKEEIERLAGESWKELLKIKGDKVRTITWGYVTMQSKREGWKPPMSLDRTKELAYLPLDCAWLREIDGRAFLYLQNW